MHIFTMNKLFFLIVFSLFFFLLLVDLPTVSNLTAENKIKNFGSVSQTKEQKGLTPRDFLLVYKFWFDEEWRKVGEDALADGEIFIEVQAEPSKIN